MKAISSWYSGAQSWLVFQPPRWCLVGTYPAAEPGRGTEQQRWLRSATPKLRYALQTLNYNSIEPLLRSLLRVTCL